MTAFENPKSLHKALPDVISDFWPSFALLRSLQSDFYAKGSSSKFSIPVLVATISAHLSLIVTIILLIISIYFTFNYYNIASIRKTVIILSISLLFKSLFSMATHLPPPCAGFSHCKCSEYINKIESINLYLENNQNANCQNQRNTDKFRKTLLRSQINETILDNNTDSMMDDEHLNASKNRSPFTIALTNALSFGLGRTGSVPRCGGLMMSGHAILQLCLGTYFVDLMKNVSEPKFRAAFIAVFSLTTISFLNSILFRDEYTLSIAASIVFVNILYKLYWCAQAMLDIGYGPFITSKLGLILSDLEEVNEMPTSQI